MKLTRFVDPKFIKGLRSKLTSLVTSYDLLKFEISNKQKDQAKLKIEIDSLKENLASYENDQELRVSEHAVIRYLERVKGIDMEVIKAEILDEAIVNIIEKLGESGSYPSKDSKFLALVKNYTVVTVIKINN